MNLIFDQLALQDFAHAAHQAFWRDWLSWLTRKNNKLLPFELMTEIDTVASVEAIMLKE